MDAIASSVAGVSPERQAKRVQINALQARRSKRSETARVELVDATAKTDEIEPRNQDPIRKRAYTDPKAGHLLNIIA